MRDSADAALNDAEYHATMGTPISLVMPDDEFTSIPLAQYVDSVPGH